MNPIKQVILALGLAAIGLVVLAPGNAFARGGGGFHGGGGGSFHAAPAFRGGGGFHAAPAVRGGVAFHGTAPRAYGGGFAGGGYHAPYGARGGVGPRYYGVGARTFVPGYWGWRGGARIWIDGGYMTAPSAGWAWIAPRWSWNGVQWVWQEGYWAPPSY